MTVGQLGLCTWSSSSETILVFIVDWLIGGESRFTRLSFSKAAIYRIRDIMEKNLFPASPQNQDPPPPKPSVTAIYTHIHAHAD